MASRKKYKEIAPEDIFLDSSNLPEFDTYQFEGRLEKPIPKKTHYLLLLSLLVIIGIFMIRIWNLQIIKGEAYLSVSENNRLDQTPLFARRGVIYDRNAVPLAQNDFPEGAEGDMGSTFPFRVYAKGSGLGHVLGYVGYPKKDSSGYYFQEDTEGLEGVEKHYNSLLAGENGSKIVETNALGEVVSESVVHSPRDGDELNLSIDSRVQQKFYEFMAELADDVGFNGGAGVILDVWNGEILALVSYPEYDPQVITDGEDETTIAELVSDERNPYLNRVTAGLYAPGSVIKPFIAIGALDKGVIDPESEIYSAGFLEVPNPYDPSLSTIFKDWKAHGYVDMRRAIAVSSNVYFFEIGGGFEDQAGIGISGIERYTNMFEIGNETGIDLPTDAKGVIPNPKWKRENFAGDDWRLGDTYNTAIGQYGFQVTPIQMARAVAAIANDGLIVEPHLRIDESASPVSRVRLSDGVLQIVREGMRKAVLEGTAKGLYMLSLEIAAKTGTAELGSIKKNVNSWVIGFFPFEEPRYAFATVMERGPATNLIGSLFVMRRLLEWMSLNTLEYMD